MKQRKNKKKKTSKLCQEAKTEAQCSLELKG